MQNSEAHTVPLIALPRIAANAWIVLAVLTLGYFMILLDTSIVSVALPDMERGLAAGFDQILWVVNAYILVFAVLLITAGRLGDIVGRKRLFLAGLALFTLASAACGLSQNASQLILFRAVQGMGAALLTPQTLVILTTIFPPERRGAAFGVISSVAGLAVVVGPTVGGWLVTNYSWQAIFFVNIPVGVLAVVAGILIVPEVRSGRTASFDPFGVLLASSGLFAISFALIESQRYDWGPISSLGAFSIGSTRWAVLSVYSLLTYALLLLALFVWWETRAVDPVLPLSLFRDRNFSVANLIGGLIGVPFAIFVVLSLYLQSVMGFSAAHTGLTLIPTSLGIMIMGPVAGRLSDRINGKYAVLAGLVVAAGGVVLTADVLTLPISTWQLVAPLAITGIGLGFVFAPLTTLAMRDVPPALAGAASGFLFTGRQVGQVLGSATVGSVLANQVAWQLPRQAARLAPPAACLTPWSVCGRFPEGEP